MNKIGKETWSPVSKVEETSSISGGEFQCCVFYARNVGKMWNRRTLKRSMQLWRLRHIKAASRLLETFSIRVKLKRVHLTKKAKCQASVSTYDMHKCILCARDHLRNLSHPSNRQQQLFICDAELPTRIDLAPFITAAFVLRFNWICESLWSRVDQVFVNFDAW